MSVGWILVFQFLDPITILKHILLLNPLHTLCIAHPIHLLKERKKNKPTIESGKILLPFIILGARPASILGPETDQLG
jgi:hypothetical protein